MFASEVKAILAHPDVPRKPNEDLLADFALLERLRTTMRPQRSFKGFTPSGPDTPFASRPNASARNRSGISIPECRSAVPRMTTTPQVCASG